jgi:hypothetical protein
MSQPSTPPRSPAAPAEPSSDTSPRALLAQTARLAARGAIPHVAAAESPTQELTPSSAALPSPAHDEAAPQLQSPQQLVPSAPDADAASAAPLDADSGEAPGDLSLDDGVHGELEAEVDDDAASGSVSRSGTLPPPGEGESSDSTARRALAQRTAESEAQERERVQREKEAVDRALHAVVGSAIGKGDSADERKAQGSEATDTEGRHPEGLPGHEPDAPADDEVAEDTESEEAEEEPHLKYSRLKNGAAEVLLKDSASAMAVSDRVVVSADPSQRRSPAG